MWEREEDGSVGSGLIFKWFLIACLLSLSLLQAGQPSKKIKAAVAPYLLPSDHPIKPIVDDLFTSSRVILNIKSLKAAGFNAAKPRKFTKLIVTTHPALKGYIFKLYLDAQRPHKDKPEHAFWILRVRGAEKVRCEIKRRGVEKLFKVPRKWIYALPKQKIPTGYDQKFYILIEEDMDIFSDRKNKRLWASDFVTPTLLRHLYDILKAVGLKDCAKPSNVPFGKDGKIAFVDTQSFGSKAVPFDKLTPSLSPKNQEYWKKATRK